MAKIDFSDFKSVKLLHDRKQRYAHRLYLAEGSRMVLDLMSANPLDLEAVYATREWIGLHGSKVSQFLDIIYEVSVSRLQAMASLRSTNEVMAIVKFPVFNTATIVPKISYYLDKVRDPGNLGTIIRTADWFGINEIFLSPECADPFNNKSVQASMSSVARIRLTELTYEKLNRFKHIVITSSGGKDYRQFIPTPDTLICLGNEAHGISLELQDMACDSIMIPSNSLGAESLNVSIAAGILMAHYNL
ncbi:MAG: hypothetical protein K1X68_02270 [Saprospiraceae bacterium]|nr:hypothetical protein [Saprospiraceae bacterium]HMW38836.1 TrmH family RNA methyltransferase [Saprospiraceae bacterium]HMX89386.1 TrmH family RNA methyltransferase [Saprospiraceae bacterium]HMZ40815.1 TrmH family RNA methyltransferase [Saprospiraceae bacterium]HNA63593.1 TrmH family RNA methyltransferase [Saprospiraceae bacterium]